MTTQKFAAIMALFIGAVALSAVPAYAKSTSNPFMPVYNTIDQSYTSIQNIVGAHNSFVKGKHANCAHGQAKKWWVYKYRKDVKAVTKARNKLVAISAKVKQKHHKTYGDFVKGFKDLTGFMNGKIAPRLLTCKAMPTDSFAFESDLTSIRADLGINIY